ncbi:MAG TPA: maleylpyruvate isomerase N-terminal domain-containing protein [Thermomicrobiales bacterium]|nr:maleylpyruvate isomerase N-terminal domain-containing protein [Thermomicrobiales bacterium]
MDKANVLARVESARAAFDRQLVEVGETRMEQPGVMGDWSVKDLLAHIMAYDRWTAAQLNAAREGREATSLEAFGVAELPPGADSDDLDTRNAALRDYYRDAPLADIIAGAEHAFGLLVAAIQELDQSQLDDPGFLGWGEDLTTTDCIAIQSWDHYEDHEPQLRAWILRDEGLPNV